MTLEKYKNDIRALQAEAKSFSGTPEEALEFTNKLSEKYAEVCQFNQKAMECENLDEFQALANSVGMEFSSEESAETLFSKLHDAHSGLVQIAQKYANGAEIGDDELEAVAGGGPVGIIVGAVAGAITGTVAGIGAYKAAKKLGAGKKGQIVASVATSYATSFATGFALGAVLPI